VTGNLIVGQAGQYGGGTGKYEMWGGTLTVGGKIVVGDTGNSVAGSGEFLQRGGTVTVDKELVISVAPIPRKARGCSRPVQ